MKAIISCNQIKKVIESEYGKSITLKNDGNRIDVLYRQIYFLACFKYTTYVSIEHMAGLVGMTKTGCQKALQTARDRNQKDLMFIKNFGVCEKKVIEFKSTIVYDRSNYPLHVLKQSLFDINQTLNIIRKTAEKKDLDEVEGKRDQIRIAITLIERAHDYRGDFKRVRDLDTEYIRYLLKQKKKSISSVADMFGTTRYQIEKITI